MKSLPWSCLICLMIELACSTALAEKKCASSRTCGSSARASGATASNPSKAASHVAGRNIESVIGLLRCTFNVKHIRAAQIDGTINPRRFSMRSVDNLDAAVAGAGRFDANGDVPGREQLFHALRPLDDDNA